MKKIVLVDLYNLFIRNFHVVEVSNMNGDHYGGVWGVLRAIKNLLHTFDPDDVIIVTDGPGSGLRRKVKDSGYKSDRKAKRKKTIVKAYDFLNENERKDNFSLQLRELSTYIDMLPVKQIKIPFVEADDVMAEIAHIVNSDTEVIMYSTDSDFKQLINDRVVCYNPSSKKLMGETEFTEKHGYRPSNYIYFKCVNGDKSDCISGIRGIGEKTFLKLFPEVINEDIGCITDLVNLSQKVIKNPKLITASMLKKHEIIVENEDLLQHNWELMQLQIVDISPQAKTQIAKTMMEKSQTFNRRGTMIKFLRDGLNQQVKYFEGWIDPFFRLVIKQRRNQNV